MSEPPKSEPLTREQARMQRRDERQRQRSAAITRPEGLDENAVMRVLVVPPELAGMRLDRFVQGQLRATSRSHAQRIIKVSAFSPVGLPLQKNRRMKGFQRIILWRPPWDEDDPNIDLDVIYEDPDLLAVNKPPDLVVHPTARHHRRTVSMILAAERPSERLTLIHRIDRETSGVLLVARTRAADRAVKIQFEQRRDVLKRYLAIVWGVPSWRRRTCNLPLHSDVDSPYRVRMAVAPAGAGQPSSTTFELLQTRRRKAGPGQDGERLYSMIRCTLHTGRQHQIRVHLAALGLPVVGDKLYGPDPSLFARGADDLLTNDDRTVLELDRQALHAADITIDQPTSGRRLRVEAPLFPDMAEFWDSLKV